MHAFKRMSRLTLLIFLLGASGCYTFGTLQSDLAPSPETADPHLTVRVTTFDGAETVLRGPWLNERVVGGKTSRRWGGSEKVEIPWAEVDLVEEKFLDRRTTLKWVSLVLGLVIATRICRDGGC